VFTEPLFILNQGGKLGESAFSMLQGANCPTMAGTESIATHQRAVGPVVWRAFAALAVLLLEACTARGRLSARQGAA